MAQKMVGAVEPRNASRGVGGRSRPATAPRWPATAGTWNWCSGIRENSRPSLPECRVLFQHWQERKQLVSCGMARGKASSDSTRGFGDIIGIVLMCAAVLLLAALLSYNQRDVSANTCLPTRPRRTGSVPRGLARSTIAVLDGRGGVSRSDPAILVGLGCFFERSPICASAGCGRWCCWCAASGCWTSTVRTCATSSCGSHRRRRDYRQEPEQAHLRLFRHRRRHDPVPDAVLHQPAVPHEFPAGGLDSHRVEPDSQGRAATFRQGRAGPGTARARAAKTGGRAEAGRGALFRPGRRPAASTRTDGA